MNIVEVLTEDHEELQNVMKKCSYSRNPAMREKLFVELKQSFEMHSYLEQLIFYPALMDVGIDPSYTRARQNEIVELMAKLDALTPEDEEWSSKYRVIRKRIEGYILEEEQNILNLSREKIDPKLLEELGAAMVAKTAEQRAVQ